MNITHREWRDEGVVLVGYSWSSDSSEKNCVNPFHKKRLIESREEWEKIGEENGWFKYFEDGSRGINASVA